LCPGNRSRGTGHRIVAVRNGQRGVLAEPGHNVTDVARAHHLAAKLADLLLDFCEGRQA